MGWFMAQEPQSGTDRITVNEDVYGPICRPVTGQDVTDLWEYAVIQAHRDHFSPLSVMQFPKNPVLRPTLEISDTGIEIWKCFGCLQSV